MLRIILDRLPPHSHYIAAKRDDPEVAMAIARRLREGSRTGGAGLSWRPRSVDWTGDSELAGAIFDRLGEVTALLADMPIRGKKRKAKPPRRIPRPVTGIERAEKQLAMAHYESLLADVEEAKARWRAQEAANLAT